MFSAKNVLLTAAIATLCGVGTLAVTAGTASAYVVCSASGDCWHTDSKYKYAPEVKAQVHPDHWYFHQTWTDQKDRQMREYHAGRGYYRNRIWITF